MHIYSLNILPVFRWAGGEGGGREWEGWEGEGKGRTWVGAKLGDWEEIGSQNFILFNFHIFKDQP